MKVIDLYSTFTQEFKKAKGVLSELENNNRFEFLFSTAKEWDVDLSNVERWLNSAEYARHQKTAADFIERTEKYLDLIQNHLGSLKGQIHLSPSFMTFDGFARYDKGSHTVWFGVDHPDADEDYLKVLLSHELSHVFRDHQPNVWAPDLKRLGKSFTEFTRQEYLDAVTAQEHLVSEGLATLFSQLVFPEVDLHVHHYYMQEEMIWCLQNQKQIEKAIRDCLAGDQNVWRFYGESSVGEGSPSRTQYFWAAQLLAQELETEKKQEYDKRLIEAHKRHASSFSVFF